MRKGNTYYKKLYYLKDIKTSINNYSAYKAGKVKLKSFVQLCMSISIRKNLYISKGSKDRVIK